ncbi:MAG: aldose epimerase family protein [Gilvibacter sp.]
MKKAQTINLTNALGTRLTLTNVGAAIMGLYIANKKGQLVNVVVGLKDAPAYVETSYQKSRLCLGATVGRYAGRISNGGFTLDDTFYPLESQEGFHIHGGSEGFQNQLWEVSEVAQQPHAKAVFTLKNPTGAYPGNLDITATYELSNDNELSISYTAKTDQKTVLNMANHAYFNLSETGSVGEQLLQIHADQILETDSKLIPTGGFINIDNTNCDYRQKRAVREPSFTGLDTVFVLNDKKPQLSITAQDTGITMQVSTNQKAVVVYTPLNFNGIELAEPNSAAYPAICFEAQNFPDAPNHPDFPSAVLLPGETYHNLTRYKFTVE